MEPIKDPTNPPYYSSYPVDLTCITIARHMGFDAGTAFAYVWRAGKKESLVLDIDKALWYVNYPRMNPWVSVDTNKMNFCTTSRICSGTLARIEPISMRSTKRS